MKDHGFPVSRMPVAKMKQAFMIQRPTCACGGSYWQNQCREMLPQQRLSQAEIGPGLFPAEESRDKMIEREKLEGKRDIAEVGRKGHLEIGRANV